MRIAAYLNVHGVNTSVIQIHGNLKKGIRLRSFLFKDSMKISCYFQVYGVKLSYWFSGNMETFERYMETYDPAWHSDYTVLGTEIKRTLIMVPPKERWHEINGLQRMLGLTSRFMNIGSVKSNPFYWTEFAHPTDINPLPIGPLPENPWFEKQMAEFNTLYGSLTSRIGIPKDKTGEPIGNTKSRLYRFFIPASPDIVDTWGFRNPYAGLNLPPPRFPNIAESENAYGPYRNYFKFSNKKYRIPRKLKKRLKKNPKVIPEFNSKALWER
jgi:hypothetical protein